MPNDKDKIYYVYFQTVFQIEAASKDEAIRRFRAGLIEPETEDVYVELAADLAS
ncbi:MAG TPA: hypothetical protein V6C86_21035 [Oculatellaceae cyanobacterium]